LEDHILFSEARPVRGLVIDIDGVLTIGGTPIPGVAQALDTIRQQGVPFRFLTNATMRSRAGLAHRLQGLGFSVEPGEVFTAGYVTASYLQDEMGCSRCHVLVSQSALADFAGLELTDVDPEAVVIGDPGPELNYHLLDRAFQLVLAGARLVAMQKNRRWLASDGWHPDVGAWTAALEYATGQEAIVACKPNRYAYHLVLTDLGLSPEEADQAVMISDNVAVDLVGARAAGLRTLLVETGEGHLIYRETPFEPDWTLPSLAALPAFLEPRNRSYSRWH